MSGEKCTLCGGAGDDKDCICGGCGTIAAQMRGMESCIQYWREQHAAVKSNLGEIQEDNALLLATVQLIAAYAGCEEGIDENVDARVRGRNDCAEIAEETLALIREKRGA